MKNYKMTLVGLSISVVVWLITIIFGFDLFEKFAKTIEHLERFEIDELIIPIVLFGIFAFLDKSRKQRSLKIEIEKAKIYKAMLRSAHHILNNFLNQMQLFKMTAKKTQGFPDEVLVLYDQIIKDALVQIEALGSIASVDEATIFASVAPQSRSGFKTSSQV